MSYSLSRQRRESLGQCSKRTWRMPVGQAGPALSGAGGAPRSGAGVAGSTTGVGASAFDALLAFGLGGNAGRTSAGGRSIGRPAQPTRQQVSAQAFKVLARVTLKRHF